MSKKEDKPSRKQGKPRVHKNLEGFEISVDQFGEIKSNLNIEAINSFLDQNVTDKKLTDREEPAPHKSRKKKK